MLGGDNMDLALAHLAEAPARRSGGEAARACRPAQLSQLVERCRAAKERLLAADAPASAPVTLLGAGSRLIGGARSVDAGPRRGRALVVDGFFPRWRPTSCRGASARSGLVAFGLPYASDPAITRHVAGFLQQHAEAGWPDALLLNGGVFRADAIAARLHATLGGWRGAPLQALHNADPDLAVARGAVAYGLARRGLAPRSAAARRAATSCCSTTTATARAAASACCRAAAKKAARSASKAAASRCSVGEPVRFHLVSTTAGTRASPPRPASWSISTTAMCSRCRRSPPSCAPRRRHRAARDPRAAGDELTEVGTLEVHCIAADDPAQRWKLEFQLRAESAAAAPQAPGCRRASARRSTCIERVFGARDREVGPEGREAAARAARSAARQRERWPTALLRPLFDALWQRARGRRRSADHERLWLSLAGWCLRPGFGDPLDGWRIEQLWPLFEQGVQHGRDAQVNAEWWTLWRRVAGGLDEAAQQRLLDDFALNLRGDEAGIRVPSAAARQGRLGRHGAPGRFARTHPGRAQGGDRRLAGRALQRPAAQPIRRRATPGRCGPSAASARARPSTAAPTAWCRPTPPPPGSTRCSRWTGNASKARPPPRRTWRA